MAIGEFHLSSHFASMQVVGSTPATPSLCPVNLNQKKLYQCKKRVERWTLLALTGATIGLNGPRGYRGEILGISKSDKSGNVLLHTGPLEKAMLAQASPSIE